MEYRFYELKPLVCAICQTEMFWAKRTDVKDSFVIVHPVNPRVNCELTERAFYAPAITLSEIKGRTVRDKGDFTMFTPEFASASPPSPVPVSTPPKS